MPLFTVLVLNWNGKHLLGRCLGALRRQTQRDFEIILIDNGSCDDSVSYVRDHFPECQILALPQNRGFCGAYNEGWKMANGALIALLSNDVEVHPDWLKAMYEASEAHPEAGLFASKMLFGDHPDTIDNCGMMLNATGAPESIGRMDKDGSRFAVSRYVLGACAGAAVYRRRMIEEVGLFDPDFFLIYEDFDLSFRAQLQGYRCVFVAPAIVYHGYRQTIGHLSETHVYYSQRNIEFAFVKNLPLPLLVRFAVPHLIYNLGSCLYFLRAGRGRPFFRAKIDALRWLPRLLKKRAEIQRRCRVPPQALLALVQAGWLKNNITRFLRGGGHS